MTTIVSITSPTGAGGGANCLVPPRMTITLPRLRIGNDWSFTPPTSHSAATNHLQRFTWNSSPVVSHAFNNDVNVPTPPMVRPAAATTTTTAAASMVLNESDLRSPSSPSGFAQTEHLPRDQQQFGLAHLLKAAQQCGAMENNNATPTSEAAWSAQPLSDENSLRESISVSSPSAMALPPPSSFALKRPRERLPSLADLMESDHTRHLKQPRCDFAATSPTTQIQQPLQQPYAYTPAPLPASSSATVTSPMAYSPHSFVTSSVEMENDPEQGNVGGSSDGGSVWEQVLTTNQFPPELCLSEGNFGGNGSNKQEDNNEHQPVKQGRWSYTEKEFAENLIHSVQKGEATLPPNVSLRKFIAANLQCKAMRVSKKFRNLRTACPTSSRSTEECNNGEVQQARDGDFNALSLRNIMNDETSNAGGHEQSQTQAPSSPCSSAYSECESSGDQNSPKKTSGSSTRTLKRSDYSQHGVVRSGRWSTEEENYAKAMIEAFKAGYLPLHGNISLRKFLSEVLYCHPMRISKKFVGYVRKYHWYRIAAGKCDPEAKRLALLNLAKLERIFWNSLQNTNEWVPNKHDLQQVEAKNSPPC